MLIWAWNIAMLALTVWREARGEPELGQIAVAWVCLNRAFAKQDDVANIVIRSEQFSAMTHAGDPNLVKWPYAIEIKSILMLCLKCWYGFEPDPTHGATNYHAKGIMPSWARADNMTVAIGNHVFYHMENF